jgi:hypothetical protein
MGSCRCLSSFVITFPFADTFHPADTSPLADTLPLAEEATIIIPVPLIINSSSPIYFPCRGRKHSRLDCKGDAREAIGDRKVIDRIHTVNGIPIDSLLESPLDDDG